MELGNIEDLKEYWEKVRQVKLYWPKLAEKKWSEKDTMTGKHWEMPVYQIWPNANSSHLEFFQMASPKELLERFRQR